MTHSSIGFSRIYPDKLTIFAQTIAVIPDSSRLGLNSTISAKWRMKISNPLHRLIWILVSGQFPFRSIDLMTLSKALPLSMAALM